MISRVNGTILEKVELYFVGYLLFVSSKVIFLLLNMN